MFATITAYGASGHAKANEICSWVYELGLAEDSCLCRNNEETPEPVDMYTLVTISSNIIIIPVLLS